MTSILPKTVAAAQARCMKGVNLEALTTAQARDVCALINQQKETPTMADEALPELPRQIGNPVENMDFTHASIRLQVVQALAGQGSIDMALVHAAADFVISGTRRS